MKGVQCTPLLFSTHVDTRALHVEPVVGMQLL
jgi:hypothetical protein